MIERRDVSHRSLAVVAVSFTTVAWGLVPLVIKQVRMPALSFAMYRLWLGVLVYGVAMLVTRRRLRWSTLRACALGGVFFGADIALTFNAFKLTSVANATIIGALAPVFIALGASRWFGERLGRRDIWIVAASFAGVALVAVGSSGSPAWSPLGDAFAALSTLSWTAYWLFSKRARRGAGALEYMVSVMLVAAAEVTVVTVVSGVPASPPAGADWGWIWLVTLVPGATGHIFLAWSHRHVEARLSALITQCVPVVGAVAAWAILEESLTALAIAGGLVVLASTAAILLRVRAVAPEEVGPPTPATAG